MQLLPYQSTINKLFVKFVLGIRCKLQSDSNQSEIKSQTEHTDRRPNDRYYYLPPSERGYSIFITDSINHTSGSLLSKMTALAVITKKVSNMSQNRSIATKILNSTLKSLEKTNDAIEIIMQRGNDRKPLVIPLVWLRDHCRDAKSFNKATNQRKSNAANLFREAMLEGIYIIDGIKLAVWWKDGLCSEFLVDDLTSSSQDQHPKLDEYVKPWKHLCKEELPRMQISSFSMRTFAEFFVKYGMVIVDGVEATPQATETLCRSVAPIHDTFFGAFWVFSNKTQEKGEEYHEDSAYGNEEIGPHTDGTYFNRTPGIQVMKSDQIFDSFPDYGLSVTQRVKGSAAVGTTYGSKVP
ncbi:hypothetical protein RB195_018375 [Necator americanus]|uniref:TauD/TfdA-like domain-containing protein n=1 Tax=Necator americanus TaxID=51031 RepID=A0ABR1CBH7_NECAM